MTDMLRVAGVMIPIIGVGQVMLLGTRAFKNMRETAAIRNIVQPGARVVFVAVALLTAQTQLSAFVGLLCAELLTTCAATWSLHRKLPLVGPTKPIAMGEIMTFALPAWGTRLLETLRGQMFPLLLGSLVRVSASAAFVASSRIAVIPSAIIGTINTAYTPMVGDLHMQKRRGDLLALSRGVGKWSFMLGFPIFCLQVSFPTEILSLFGRQFRAATPALIVLAIGMLFNFSTGPSTRTLMASGRSRLALIDYIIVLSVEIGLSLWLIPSVGLLGAAIARATGSALNNGLPLWQVWRLERLHPYTWDYWKPLVAGVAAAGAARVMVSASGLGDGLVSALAGAATLCVAYLLVIILLRLSEEDQAVIRGLIQRMRRRPRPAAAGGSTTLD
jgi:O-antigen/teichoic acid export membrane protein